MSRRPPWSVSRYAWLARGTRPQRSALAPNVRIVAAFHHRGSQLSRGAARAVFLEKDRGALAKDDRLDVLAMAVQYWVEQMDRDVKTIEQDHKAKLLDAEIDQKF